MRLHRSLLGVALALFSAFALAQNPPTTPPPVSTTQAPTEKTLTKENKDELLQAITDIISNRAFVPGVDMTKWQEYLDKEKDAIDKSEKDTEFTRAINNALRDFGVSHIRLLAPRAATARTQVSTVSVGVMARAENNTLVVTRVIDKSPASDAGIKVGDVITMVDGKAPDSPQVLQGEKDTEVVLKVKSGTDEKEYKLKRASVSTVRPETLTWVGDDTAVLRIWTFSTGYSRDNIETLMKQANGKAKYLVLDLRSNGGGSTANLQHLLSLLLPPDTAVGTFISKQTVKDFEKDHTPSTDPIQIAAAATRKYKTRKLDIDPFKGKIAVLVNRGSASASEICASALHDCGGAIVVGSKSAGAVLASIFGRLPQGFQLQYPVSDYVTIKGTRLEKHPIEPDLEVSGAPAEGKDPVVDKAVEKLKSGA